MPRYLVTDPEGNKHYVTGPGSQEDALAHFQSQWQPTPKSAPMPTGDQMADTTAKGLGGIGSLLGVAAPIVAGEAVIPAVGGLVGAGLVGAGTKAVLDKAGTTQMLNNAADKLEGPEGPYHAYQESDVKHPIIGGTAANMIANLGSATRPAALAGESLRAIPEGAATLAGGLAAPGAAQLTGGIGKLLTRGEGLPFVSNAVSDALIPRSKVPLGQEGPAIVNTLADMHGTPSLPAGAAPDFGTMKQALQGGGQQLGAAVGAAKGPAFAAVNPEGLGSAVQGAIQSAMTENPGNFPGAAAGAVNPRLSIDPKAAKVLAGHMAAAEDIQTPEEAANIQTQLYKAAQMARKKTSPSSPVAALYERAAGKIGEAIQSSIPGPQLEALQAANKPFGDFRDIQKLALASADSRGNVDPQKFLAGWNTMTPAERAAADPNGQIAALVKQPNAGGFGDRLTQALTSLGDLHVGTGLGQLLLGKNLAQPPVRFNAPQPVAATAQAYPNTLQQSGGIAGLLGGR